MKVVVALGGNALGKNVKEQIDNARLAARYIVDIINDGHQLVITHGNGPQVGLINQAFETSKVLDMPFSECGAMSQGYIGYHLQNAIIDELNKRHISKNVASVVTMVEVNESDEAFKDPTKPIGLFYSKEEASKLPYPTKEDAGRGYRRVIASPKPINIVELDTIKSLVNNNIVPICCGGGGIPVIKSNDSYVRIDAVIDKDFASSLLADKLDFDCLLILTNVKNVYINYKQENQEMLEKVSVDKIKSYNESGHFAKGSMKPKVEAGINFVNNKTNRIAIITSIDNAADALKGISGTIITK